VTGNLANLANVRTDDKLTFHHADICDRIALEPIFFGADAIFHLAGIADIVRRLNNRTITFGERRRYV